MIEYIGKMNIETEITKSISFVELYDHVQSAVKRGTDPTIILWANSKGEHWLFDIPEDDKETLETMIHCKKRIAAIENNLSNREFISKAPEGIIALERKRLSDFKDRWMISSVVYCFIK